MNFLKKIKNSIYNPAFYKGLTDAPLSASFKYFFGLIAVLSVILAFVFGVEVSPMFTLENLKKIVDLYPAELAIQIKGGVVSTNVTEPYIVKTFAPQKQVASKTNLVVIDTKQDFSVERFKAYDTSVLIGKNFVVSSQREGKFEFNDLSKMPDFSLNHARILGWANKISSHHTLISFGVFCFFFLAFMGFFSVNLLWLLLIALIVFMFMKIRKTIVTFRTAYKISIQAITLTLLLITVFILAGYSAPFNFFWSMVTFIIIIINLKDFHTSVPDVPEVVIEPTDAQEKI